MDICLKLLSPSNSHAIYIRVVSLCTHSNKYSWIAFVLNPVEITNKSLRNAVSNFKILIKPSRESSRRPTISRRFRRIYIKSIVVKTLCTYTDNYLSIGLPVCMHTFYRVLFTVYRTVPRRDQNPSVVPGSHDSETAGRRKRRAGRRRSFCPGLQIRRPRIAIEKRRHQQGIIQRY